MASVKSMSLTILALCVATPLGVNVRSSSEIDLSRPDHIESFSRDSHPGTPAITWKANGHASNIEALGDRLIKAADANEAMQKCDSFFSSGDYTWCDKAMPKKTAYAKNPLGYIGNSYVLKNSTQSDNVQESIGQFQGLSYGIQLRDPWSELMSNRYLVDTKLYDCYVKGPKGPMYEDLHAGFSKDNQCREKLCYTSKYEAHKVCVGPEKKQTADHDGRELKYEPLSAALEDRAPLSTFVKMDVEGAELSALRQLVGSPSDMAKIRTLDMEVHFHLDRDGNDPHDAKVLEDKVRIMELLAKNFAVTGSTLEPLYTAMKGAADRKPKTRNLLQKVGQFIGVKQEAEEEGDQLTRNAVIWGSSGMGLNQYCISFVNRKLL